MTPYIPDMVHMRIRKFLNIDDDKIETDAEESDTSMSMSLEI